MGAAGAALAGRTGLEGLVIAHLGKSVSVETDRGTILLCHGSRRLETPVVGDRVVLEPAPAGDTARIVQILPRRSLLNRPEGPGKLRPFAANLDLLLVVVAPEPPVDLLLVDQYLAVCEQLGIETRLLLNKCDLPQAEALGSELEPYRDAGYRVLAISTHAGTGMVELQGWLQGRTSLLTGQSGVGKSSLTRRLLPGTELRVGGLSEKSGLGQHTTTTARLFHLPCGGHLIDTPGLNIFGLSELDERALADGYREFRALQERCRFNDCRHVHDKGCAVRAAVDAGRLDAGRYTRYLRLREKLPRPTY